MRACVCGACVRACACVCVNFSWLLWNKHVFSDMVNGWCPGQYYFEPEYNLCWRIGWGPSDRFEAEKVCRREGAHLIVLNTLELHSYIHSFLQSGKIINNTCTCNNNYKYTVHKKQGYLDNKNCSTYKINDTHLKQPVLIRQKYLKTICIKVWKFHPGTRLPDHKF